MPNDEFKFSIPIEESRRSRFGTQEQKALGRRLAGRISSRAIDRPTIGKRRNRSFGSGATGGIAGSLDPRDMSMVDFDRDGWAREGSTNPVWVGVKPVDRLSSLSSGNEKTKPRKPSYPRKPTYGPLLGRANEVFKGVTNWEEFKQRYQDTEITYIDYETTGLVFDKWGKSSGNGAPVQIGAIKVKGGKVTARFEMYVNPNIPFDKWEKWSQDTLVDYEQNPLSDKFLSDKASIAEAHRKLVEFIGPNAILGVQNAAFDKDVLEDNLSASGIDWRPDGWIDLKDVAGMTLPRWSEESQDGPKRFDKDENKWVPSNSLKDITKYLGVALEGHHTADVDAEATANSMDELIDRAIKNNWNVDLFDPTKRDNLVAKSEKKYKEDMDAFPEKVEKYLQILEDLDAAEKRSLSSGDKTDKKQSKTRPIIKMNPGEKSKLKQHRQTDYNYGDKSELGGEIRRSRNDWMKGMTSQQIAKLLVPESKQQHFDMWIDDWAPQAKDDKKIVDAFRKYWDEMEAANPWDSLDYSPENVELTRRLISEALDDNPIMKWAFETHGSPMIGILSKEAVEAYENTPSLKAKLEEIQRRRNLKNRPTFGAKTSARFDLVSFNSSRIRERVNNEGTIVPWLFGAGKPTDSTHHVDNSVAGTLLHEWGHWVHFRAVRDYEIGMSGKPSNRTAYYGTGNPQDNSYIQALSVASEYNHTSMDFEMMERHRAGGDINETKDKPRLLTSYGNVNMAEAMAEGIAAYLHPNQEMKYLVMNEKLRRDVESILNIEDGETPWESIAQSTERSLSSGITEKQRSVFDERIDRAKKEIEQRAYDKFVKKFDDGLDEDFEKFGTPVDGKLVLPEKDAKKLFTESIQRLIKSKRVQELFEGLAPYDWRGREAMFQAGLVKGDIASRIAESIQFTPEEFISTFKRSSLDSADPNHKSYKKFLSFEDSKNFKMIEAILSGDNKSFGLNLRTGDIEPQGVSEEIIKARQATHELIELNLRELTLAQIRQAFLKSNFQGPAESDPFLVLWKNFENTSNDSNQLLKYAADPKPVGPNPPPWNPDGSPLPPKDPLELDVRGTTVTRTINIVDDTWSRFSHFNGIWVDEISKNPNTTMRMYSLKNIETGQMHGDIFFADDNPNINWFEQEDLQKNIESNYGEFNQDDWEAVVITKDNWDSETVEDVFTAQMIKLLSDEYGMGMNARFKGTQIFDADSPEGVKILKQTVITDLIRTWAISSNNENIVALTMQNIIRKEFGLSDAIGWDRNTGLAIDPKQTEILPSNVAFDSGIDLSPDAEAMLRNVVRAQYEATQEYFKIRNIEYVALYRGVTGLNDKEVKEKIAKFEQRDLFQPIIRDEIVMRPASSWSFEPSTAEDFTTASNTNTENPAIIKSFVPVKNILSIPFTGFGCLHEEEAVVLGRPIDAYVGVYSNRIKNVPKTDKFLSDKLKAEDGILEKIVAITPEEFFSDKDANEVSDMGLDIASEIKKALSSGSTARPTHKIKYEIAELMKRSRSLDIEYEIDEDRIKLYNGTLRKGFEGGFTVQVDHHSDVKSGIAIARNKHGLNFDAKTDFSSDGTPSADLIRRFHAWVMFHGPLTFKNPRSGAKEVTIGGWLKNGKIYLDVVDVYPNTPENKIMASRLGKKERQIAITDLDELYRLMDAGEENLDSAFISTGGDGGQTLNVRTIDKFASLMTQLDSNMARTGSNYLKEIGRLQKFKNGRRALASRRVRFSDPANPSKDIDYMLVALPGDGENETKLRAYEYSAIDIARDAVAESRGANRRDIRLFDALDYLLDPSRQNLRINKPVAEIIVKPRTSDNAQFEVQPQNVQEKYSRRGIDAALQRLHEDINPTPEMAFSSGFTTNESGSSKLKISEDVDERILNNQYSPIRTVKFSSDGTENEYLIFATGENGEFVWIFDRSMMGAPMNNIQRTASIQMHRILGQQTIPENVMNRNILRTGSREAVALREFNRIGRRPEDNEWAKLVGLMRVEGTYLGDEPGPSKIMGLTVEPNHKRRGLASAALKFHRDFWPEQNLQHSRELSGDGVEFARATPINSLSSGDESRINLSDEEKREIIAIASQRTDSFSQSVVAQFRRNGKLSDKQWRALNRMTLGRNSLSSGQNPVVPANKRYENIKGDGKGNCFDSAANLLTQLVADNPERSGDFKLVHGAPLGTGGEAKGIRFHHAWVEETVRKTDDEIETIINNYPKNMREQVRRQLGSLLSEQVLVHDNSNGREVFMPREVYYSIGNIDGDLVQKYSLEEMSKKQRENKHYGPYDLDEETESMSSDQSALLDEMENIREELENYLGTDDLESLENWVMSAEWPKDYLDVVSGKDYEFDEHYVVLQERLKSAGIPDVVVVRRQGTPLEKGNIRNGSMVSGWKGGSGKYHYGKDRKIFESLVPRENIVGIGHVEEGEIFYKLDGVETTELSLSSGRINKPSKKTTRKSSQKSNLPDTAVFVQTSKAQKKTKQINFEITPIDKNDDRVSWLDTKPTIDVSDPALPSVLREYSELIKWLDGKPSSWSSNGYSNTELLLRPNDRWDLNEFLIEARAWVSPAKFVEIKDKKGRKKIYAIVHSGPEEINVYDVEQLEKDLKGKYDFRNWDDIKEIYTYDPKFKNRKSVIAAKMTTRRGPERDSPWEISRVLVTPKHEGIGIGKTMIDFHREEFAELEATFKYKDPRSQAYGNYRSQYAPIKQQIPGPWNNLLFTDREDPDLPNAETASLSSGADRDLNILSDKIDADIVSSAIAKNKRIDALRKERIKDLKDSGYLDATKDSIEEQDRWIKEYMDPGMAAGEFAERWSKKPYPVLTDMEKAMDIPQDLIPLSEIEKEAKKLGITIRNPKHNIYIKERRAVVEPFDADAFGKEYKRIFEKYQNMRSEGTITDWSDLEIRVMDFSFEIANDDIELNETNNSESKRQKIREDKPDSRSAPEYELRSFDSLSMDEQEELITRKIINKILYDKYWDLTRKFSDRAEFDAKWIIDDSTGLRITYDHETLKRKPRKKTRAELIKIGEQEYRKLVAERDKKKRENDDPSLSSGGREDADWNDEIKSLSNEIEEVAKTLDDISKSDGVAYVREVTSKGKLIDIDNPTQEQTLLIPTEEIMKAEAALNRVGKKALDMASSRVVRSGFCSQKDLDEAIAHQSRPEPEPQKTLLQRAIDGDPKIYPFVKKEVDEYRQKEEKLRLARNELTKATKELNKHMRDTFMDTTKTNRTDEQKREMAEKFTELREAREQAKENKEVADDIFSWALADLRSLVEDQILWAADVLRQNVQTDEEIKKQGYDKEKQSQYLQIHRAVAQEIRKMLAEHRTMSTEYPKPVETIEPVYYKPVKSSREQVTGASREKQELIIKLAASVFPKGLLQKIKNVSIQLQHNLGGNYSNTKKTITTDADGPSTLIHEIVHALTYHSEIMRSIEQAALTRRTWGKSGDTTTPMEEKIKQGRQKVVNEIKAMKAKYRSKYKTDVTGEYILDAFVDPYQGRIYKHTGTGGAYSMSPTELLTVAMENLFADGRTMRQGRADRDLMATALGALLTAEKKSDSATILSSNSVSSLSSGSEFSNELNKIKIAKIEADSMGRKTESFKLEDLDNKLIDSIDTEIKKREKILLAEQDRLENADNNLTEQDDERLRIIDNHLSAVNLAEKAISLIRANTKRILDPDKKDIKLITSRSSDGKLLGLALVDVTKKDIAIDRASLYEGMEKPQPGKVLFMEYLVNLEGQKDTGRNLFGKILEESTDDNVSLIQLESSDSGASFWQKMGFDLRQTINNNAMLGNLTPYYFLHVSPSDIREKLK